MDFKWNKPISLVLFRIFAFVLFGVFCAWLDFLKDSHLDNTYLTFITKIVAYSVVSFPIGVGYSILRMNWKSVPFPVAISVSVVSSVVLLLLLRSLIFQPQSYESTVTILATKDVPPIFDFYEKMYLLSFPFSIGILLFMEKFISKVWKEV